MINDYEIRTYINPLIDQRMYLIASLDCVIIIDPFESADMYKHLELLSVSCIVVLLTHEHYDHISGVNALRKRYVIEVWSSEKCKENIVDLDKNRTKSFPLLFIGNKKKYREVREMISEQYVCVIDRTFNSREQLQFGSIKVDAIPIGGHSEGSSLYIINDFIFAGDNLLGNKMELNSYGANKKKYCECVIPFFMSMKASTVVYPGHGESDTVGGFLERMKEDGVF